jgi:hypothetical protein
MSDTHTHDELAGVVDLFDALTQTELTTALTELAFKRGEEPDAEVVEATIENAIDDYALVVVDDPDQSAIGDRDGERDGETSGATRLLVPGPTAFPSLPPAAEDLPHIMDVPERTIDREAVGERVLTRLRTEAADAVDVDDRDRAEQLLDVSYDLEAWAPVAADDVRETLDELLDG